MLNQTSAVETSVDRFLQCFQNCDAKGFAAAFAEDGIFTNVFGQTSTGRAAIEQRHEPMFTAPRTPGLPLFVGAQLNVLEKHLRLIRPDVATADIKWRQTGAIAPNGQPWGERIGLLSLVLTHEDGGWQIATMHNMDLPLQRPS